MTVYVDTSVLLRMILRQPGELAQWGTIGSAVSSALVEVECLRTLDRFRIIEQLSDQDSAARRRVTLSFLAAIDLIAINSAVLSRAAQPLPTVLGTLDAIHLATALLWREEKNADLVIATHDDALGLAAVAHGFDVIGVS